MVREIGPTTATVQIVAQHYFKERKMYLWGFKNKQTGKIVDYDGVPLLTTTRKDARLVREQSLNLLNTLVGKQTDNVGVVKIRLSIPKKQARA